MDTLFLLLFFASILALVVGLIKPTVFARFLKERATRKGVGTIFGIATVAFFILFGIATDTDAPPTERQISEQTEVQRESAERQEVVDIATPEDTQDTAEVSEPAAIDFSVLREWNPDDDPQAVGLEILISETDATEEKIINLIRTEAANTQKAVIKVYQDRRAWEEEQSGEYTAAYDRGYLAFYVKNLTSSGAYRGRNEIRWFQAEGQLKHLMGTTTELD